MTVVSIAASLKTCRKCQCLYSESRCQPCYKKQRAEYRANNVEKIRAAKAKHHIENRGAILLRIRLWQAANKEKISEAAKLNYRESAEGIKAKVKAYYYKNREVAIARVRAYRLANSDRVRRAQRLSMAKYRMGNRERLLASARAHYRENREAKKAYGASYYRANRDSIMKKQEEDRKLNPEKYRKWSVKYKAANRDKYRAYQQNRRAKEQAGAGLSSGLANDLLVKQKGKCACCGKRLLRYHLDHILPLALGGLNEDANMQLLHWRCNLQKGHKHPADFMRQRGFLI